MLPRVVKKIFLTTPGINIDCLATTSYKCIYVSFEKLKSHKSIEKEEVAKKFTGTIGTKYKLLTSPRILAR